MRGIQRGRSGGFSTAGFEDGGELNGKECGQLLGPESDSQLTTSKETKTSLQSQELNLANNQSELGSGFFPRASEKKYSPADTLISALESPEHRTWPQGVPNYDLQNCEKFVVIFYVTIGN